MSDPLSVTASVAGLVSLGIQVVSGITKYLDAVRDCKDDVAAARTQVNRTQDLLKLVVKVAAKAEPNHSTTAAFLKDSASIQPELKVLDELVQKFNTIKLLQPSHDVLGKVYVQAKKLTYPFHRPTMDRLQSQLDRVNVGLQAALQVSGFDVALDIESTTSAIKTTLPSLAQQLCEQIKQDGLVSRDAVARVGDSVVSLSRSLDQGLAEVLESIDTTSTTSVAALKEDHAQKHSVLLQEASITRKYVSDLSKAVKGVDVGIVQLQEDIATTSTTSISLLRQDLAKTQAIVLQELAMTRSGVTELRDSFKRFDSEFLAPAGRDDLGRLISKPGQLRDFCDIMEEARARTALQHSRHRSRISGARRTCICRKRVISSRQALLWGPWQAFADSSTAHHHLPGCVYHSRGAAVSSKRWAVVFTGLQILTNRAIELSFSYSFGAGGGSLSPGFKYYPSVDRSRDPAFRIMRLFSRVARSSDFEISRGEFLEQCTENIALLYRRGKASPKAVDQYGRGVLHYFERFSLVWGLTDKDSWLTGLETLVKHGVQTTTYDINGATPAWNLTCLLVGASTEASTLGKEYFEGPGHPGWWDSQSFLTDVLCAQEPCEPIVTKCVLDFALTRNAIMELFGMIQRSPATAEAFGCGPLSLAVLEGDLKKMELVLTHYPNAINELNLLRQTPLHLAVGNPACVALLLGRSGRKLIDYPDIRGRRPVEYALFSCLCDTRAGDNQFHDADRDGCLKSQGDTSLNILLDADCMIPKVESWPRDSYSYDGYLCDNCLRVVSAHLLNRRETLKRLATNELPRMQATALGLSSSSVLDSNAIRVMQALEQCGISVPPSLQVPRPGVDAGCNELTSAYHGHHSPLPFDTLWSLGFRDLDTIDIDGLTPLMVLCKHLMPILFEEDMARCSWLIEHGADLWRLAHDGASTIAHELYAQIGRFFSGGDHDIENPREQVFHLTRKLAQRDPGDGCRCACSPGGCTPFTRFLQAARRSRYRESVSEFVERLPRILEGTHTSVFEGQMRCAVRYATFEALGIRHTCCHGDPDSLFERHRQIDDLDELRQEDRFLLAHLEDLVPELEVGMEQMSQARYVNKRVSFWYDCWHPRIQHVLASVESDVIEEPDKLATEEVGVVWHQQESRKDKGRDEDFDFDSDSYSESEASGYHESDWDSEIDVEEMFETFQTVEDWTSRLNLIMSKAGLSAGR